MKVQTVKSGKIYKDFPMFISVFILAELMMLYILKNNGFYPFGTKSMLIMLSLIHISEPTRPY